MECQSLDLTNHGELVFMFYLHSRRIAFYLIHMQLMSVGRHLIFYLLMYFFSLLFLQQMFIPKSHKSACYLVFLLASVLGVEPLFTIYRAFTNDSVTQTDFVVVSLSPFWPQNYKCETFVTFWYLSQTSFHCLFFFHCVAVLSERYFFREKIDSLLEQKIVNEKIRRFDI